MYMRIYLYTNIHSCAYVHIHMCMYVCCCIPLYMYTRMCLYVYVLVYVHVHIHLYIHVYIIYMCMCICLHTYIHRGTASLNLAASPGGFAEGRGRPSSGHPRCCPVSLDRPILSARQDGDLPSLQIPGLSFQGISYGLPVWVRSVAEGI